MIDATHVDRVNKEKSVFGFARLPNGNVVQATHSILERVDVMACDSKGNPFTQVIPWDWVDYEADNSERIASLLSEGIAQAEIARRLGVNKSTVSRHAARLQRATQNDGNDT